MLEMGEKESAKDEGEANESGCFGEKTKADEGTDGECEFDVPALLDTAHGEGEDPGDNGIEKRIVADGTVECDIHGKECGKSGCGEGDVLAPKAPNSGEIDAE